MTRRAHAGVLFPFSSIVFIALLSSLAPVARAADPDADPRLLRMQADGPVSLARLVVEATVHGSIAETCVTMTFENAAPRVLEGQLVFPLPEDAFVSGYALDIGGAMVDAVVVEKERARIVFESIERTRKDPGLVEWVAGNAFRTRVYPVPPKGRRTVRVRYVDVLPERDGRAVYTLPLRTAAPVPEITIHVEELRAGRAPRIVEDHRVEEEALDGRFEIVLPGPAAKEPLVEIDDDGGAWFFAVAEAPSDLASSVGAGVAGAGSAPAGLAAAGVAPAGSVIAGAVSARIAVIWDASFSRAGAHEAEFALLERYVAARGRAPLAVDLVVVRHEAAPPRRIVLDGGDAGPLIAALRDLDDDGASALAALEPVVASLAPDAYFLFTDGIATLGPAPALRFDAPAFALASGTTVDLPRLRALVEPSGGAVIDLRTASAAQTLEALGAAPLAFFGLDVAPGGAVSDVIPGAGTLHGARALVVGRLDTAQARVVPRFARGRQAASGPALELSRARAVRAGLLRTLWAQRRASDLAREPEANRAALLDLGRTHGLVTPATSLLVLDSPQQYIAHGIEPPASQPAWVDAYRAAMVRRRAAPAADTMESLRLAWDFRRNWWETSPALARRVSENPAGSLSVAAYVPGPRNTRELLIGATVTARSKSAEVSASLVTDENGVARFAQLPPAADYTVHVLMPGYASAEKNGIRIAAGVTTQLVLGMLAEKTETIVVSGKTKVIELGSGSDDDDAAVEDLPTFGRDYQAPLALQPGVQDTGGDGNPNVHGSRDRSLVESRTTEEVVVVGEDAAVEDVVDEDFDPDDAATLLAAWDPHSAATDALRNEPEDRAWEVYLAQRTAQARSAGFFSDAAEIFASRGENERALQVLTNLAEVAPDQPDVLRTLACRLVDFGRPDLAAQVYERVLALRAEEPQSWRDLALVLALRGDHARAIALLQHVAVEPWGRFDGIRTTALTELHRELAAASVGASEAGANAAGASEAGASEAGATIPSLDPRLPKPAPLDADLRVVLTWSSNDVDVDLWVTDPRGERAYYGHSDLRSGGMFYRDFTEGYGPEEFMARVALPGTYKVEIDYYGSHTPQLPAPVTVQVTTFRNYGRANEERTTRTLRLGPADRKLAVAEVSF